MKNRMYENKSYIEHFKKVGGSLGVLDEKSRIYKANKIISVIRDFTRNKDLSNLKCLDIGCSAGFITKILSKEFKEIIGIDMDKTAIGIAIKNNNSKAKFQIGNALNIPFNNKMFDMVICNHIYEHVPNADKLFSEIYRILKKGGVCYLSAGNKYKFIESHYKLPFLSWLPPNLANIYLRTMKRGRVYEEKHFSYWKIKKMLLKNNFKTKEYTIELIKNPKKFSLDDMIKEDSVISKIPVPILNLLRPIMPTYIFILMK